MALGCLGLALANAAHGRGIVSGGGKASWLWLFAFFVVTPRRILFVADRTVACTKVAPARYLSMTMGAWLATSFVGNFGAGWLGSFWSAMRKPGSSDAGGHLGGRRPLPSHWSSRPLRGVLRD